MSMSPPIIIVIVLLGIVMLAALAKKARGGLGVDIYRKQEQLFSAAELRFLAALDQAIAPGQRVLGKVRVADLVSVRAGLNPKLRQIAINRVAQKHVDFVVCSGATLVPVCAIELNDSSHDSRAAKRRDEFLSSVCSQVGLPLLVVKAARSYTTEEIRQQISAATQSASPGGRRSA
jgi:hypothetical protein